MSGGAKPVDVSEFRDTQRAAFERLRGEIESVSENALATINIDVGLAVKTVLGAWDALCELRPMMVKLVGFDTDLFDKLESYAHATGHAHGNYVIAITPPESLPELAARATRIRDLLLSNALNLAKHGLIERTSLGSLKGSNAYRNLALDLAALSSALRHQWFKVEDNSPLTLEDLEEAAVVSARLMTNVRIKERAPLEIAAAALTRQRAFTLLLRAYDEAQRGVTYLRWRHGDADSFAPSLYVGRNNGGRRKRLTEPPNETDRVS